MEIPFNRSKIRKFLIRMRHLFHSLKFEVKNSTEEFGFKSIKLSDGEKAMIGYCHINMFPACCGIAILNNVYISQNYRDLGFARALVVKAIKVAKDADYTILKATVNDKTPEMHHILETEGFVKIYEFVNKKTNNVVTEYQLTLNNNQ